MRFLARNRNFILLLLLEAVIGALILADPVKFTSGIIITVGVIVLVYGILNIITYFRSDPLEASEEQRLAIGLMMAIFGIFCITHTNWFILTFPLLTILYGIVTLVAGLCKLQWTVDALRMHVGQWTVPAVSSAVSILAALILLANPFTSTQVLWMFTGISLIVEAVCDLVVLIIHGARVTADVEREINAMIEGK